MERLLSQLCEQRFRNGQPTVIQNTAKTHYTIRTGSKLVPRVWRVPLSSDVKDDWWHLLMGNLNTCWTTFVRSDVGGLLQNNISDSTDAHEYRYISCTIERCYVWPSGYILWSVEYHKSNTANFIFRPDFHLKYRVTYSSVRGGVPHVCSL